MNSSSSSFEIIANWHHVVFYTTFTISWNKYLITKRNSALIWTGIPPPPPPVEKNFYINLAFVLIYQGLKVLLP